ncbi:DJ-1/PfpI family protein [Rhizobium ruizarguesonis]|uniref:DJ-1/PfpI family protein n=1 Tax=Rhizobium ruizarguesonis TaxID=2081791 RepID=UPI001030A4BD|nr:DJ-1/PfpI family protein [Rhizobium ruizarguesonis]TBD71644.1 DJ-1/PfpI family protein [Rhizobium ruizarguesonis]TBD94875.1 DJ-1/PfpI family protein [Rhizobium ruizarguesonis]WSH32185.1 DJ-1/PfpI family protein [Rhizobium ruizarguesonis]
MSLAVPILEIGFVMFPGMTQLDLTGPWEVLTRLPNSRCHLLSDDPAPVRSASGMSIVPTMGFDECGKLDIVLIPGGPGHLEAMQDDQLLTFLRKQQPSCQYLMAACTGTLIVAAAGLVRGYKCTTHWTAMDRLAAYGATSVNQRVVFDRTLATGGGVTAGIDLALAMVSTLAGEDAARKICLMMEYAPEPPFPGSPQSADPSTVKALQATIAIARQIETIDAAAVAKLE